MYLQVDADDFSAAIGPVASGALAEFSETHVTELAELYAGCNEDGVHIDAALAFEFKEHADHAAVVSSAAEYPSSVAQDGAGKRRDEFGGVVHGGCFHFERPGGP